VLTTEQRLMKAEREVAITEHTLFSRPQPPSHEEFLIVWGRVQQLRDTVEDLKEELRGADPDD
jgi:hypothetical protein